MMQYLLFLRGLAIGFALAAPVGPVGVLCIRRALAEGRHAAFVAGLGAAFADTIFGAVAGLGLTFISSFLLSHQTTIRLSGGIFLMVVAVRGWRDHECSTTAKFNGGGLAKDFCSSFLLTLSNPATILAALGVFAALGAIGLDDPAAASVLVLGVFLGSTLWWLLLSAAAGAVRSRFSPENLRLLNRGSSLVLGLTGIAILATLILDYLRR
jgi:threonine/homoserine/homoserine lactone efflux protein